MFAMADPPPLSMSERRFLLAGFQVTTIGRFWVTAEDETVISRSFR
jgi:hypothetical protein